MTARVTTALAGLTAVAVVIASLLASTALAASPEISVYPSNGTLTASPTTQISLRGASASSLRGVRVSGSSTGSHSGKLKAHSDGKGASFLPTKPFKSGETVTVKVGKPVAGVSGTTVKFKVVAALALNEIPQKAIPARIGTVTFKTRPDLQPTGINVTTDTSTSSGDIFVGPKAGPAQTGPTILDRHGRLIWFRELPAGDQTFVFRPYRYRGKPVLAWWQGGQTSGHGKNGEILILNDRYKQVAHFKAGNGYDTDFHELQITSRNTALIDVYNPIAANLTSVGGAASGPMFDNIVQEIDIKTGLVVFEWHSVGNVPLSYSFQQFDPTKTFDYFHINSVSDTSDGNLLISSRATSAIYKLNRATGKIIWRLNGKHSSFKMGKGAVFAYQHDAREHSGGKISLFDNAAAGPAAGIHSSGMILKLDTVHKRATLVHSDVYSNTQLSTSQGNFQLLPDSHAFVGWGGDNNNVSEFSASGKLVFDAHYTTPGLTSYRAYKLPWKGRPDDAPSVAATTIAGKTTVYASWNGATEVKRWRALGGATAGALTALHTFPRSNFESSLTLDAPVAFVQVQALDSKGKVIGHSSTVAPTAG